MNAIELIRARRTGGGANYDWRLHSVEGRLGTIATQAFAERDAFTSRLEARGLADFAALVRHDLD